MILLSLDGIMLVDNKNGFKTPWAMYHIQYQLSVALISSLVPYGVGAASKSNSILL